MFLVLSGGVGKSQESFIEVLPRNPYRKSYLGRSNIISKSPDIKTQDDKFRELQKVHYN